MICYTCKYNKNPGYLAPCCNCRDGEHFEKMGEKTLSYYLTAISSIKRPEQIQRIGNKELLIKLAEEVSQLSVISLQFLMTRDDDPILPLLEESMAKTLIYMEDLINRENGINMDRILMIKTQLKDSLTIKKAEE